MNMPYCMFTNTLADLRQCNEAMEDRDISLAEQRARFDLIRLCAEIVSDFGHEAGFSVAKENA